MAVIRGATLSGCQFKEEFPRNTTGRWFINLAATRVSSEKPTVVEGPRVKWQNWSWGVVGPLQPDLYNS